MPNAADAPPFVIESLGPTEQRASFHIGDSWCRATLLDLTAGMRLNVTSAHFEPARWFAVEQPPAELELVVSRGSVIRACTQDGRTFERGGNTIQLGRTRRPLAMHVQQVGDVPLECATVSLTAARLRELLGMRELPAPFGAVIASDGVTPPVTEAMTPRLYRLLDEIVHADVRGAGRALWLEAKSLELVSLVADELVDIDRAIARPASAYDVDRLERVRAHLVADLAAPPTLADLARRAGLNETKLKHDFRALFGVPVFAYLRRARMEEARRLLLARVRNVTEVALRVGYANPSKFASAFRRQFGVSPSEL